MLTLATLNLLSDLSRWPARGPWIVEQLQRLNPNVVCLQEVKLPENTAAELAHKSGYAHVFLTPKTGFEARAEGIAILSRLPILNSGWVSLGAQQRVGQFIQVELDGKPLVIANAHFFWQPGDSTPRQRQITRMLDWLDALPGHPPYVLCGDFNATPDTADIRLTKTRLRSAFELVHGAEPDYTCPTPLPRSGMAILRTLLGFFVLLRPRMLKAKWKGTLDYIFVDPRMSVSSARVAFNTPTPEDARIYPSDHFGLIAEVYI
jgi:endonuclease/exonuclease/phosphatase family metal-dependent hydrolase